MGLLLIFGTILAAQKPGPCLGVSGTAHVNWPQFHSDVCNTGYNPNEFVLSPATIVNLGLHWKLTTGGSVFHSSPAVANGLVYVGSEDGNVYALNASTGALLWKYTTESTVSSSPAVANGAVYVWSSDNNLYAFGLQAGAEQP